MPRRMMVSAALLQRCRRPSALVRCMQASATTVTADVSNFRTLRESNLTYVDKTGEIDDLLSFDRSFVLCRPPRFGKTVMLTLLKELFEGNRQLFDGTVGPRLAIADAPWDWDDEQHTVPSSRPAHSAMALIFCSGPSFRFEAPGQREVVSCEPVRSHGRQGNRARA